jgi:hypothetical protein
MQKCKVIIPKVIISTIICAALLGIFLVDGAQADGAPLEVNVKPPAVVNFAQPFNLSISVKNKTNTPVTINKVAVGLGYTQQLLKFRGPYELPISPQNVPAFGTISFSVPFRITDGSGQIVALTVILSSGTYDQGGILGAGLGGAKVN